MKPVGCHISNVEKTHPSMHRMARLSVVQRGVTQFAAWGELKTCGAL